MSIIHDLQIDTGAWRERNFPDYTAHEQFMGMVEEMGELSHAIIKGMQNIRHTPGEIHQLKEDAVADLFIFMLGYCTKEGIDFEQALYRTWNQVRKRDWVKYPETGRPPEEET
jgi:NTP pyrophosphatase (non-canonical NTP hydrolase)